MNALDLKRQSTLIPSGIGEASATVVGCGAIGSHVAEALAKIGLGKLVLYDDDVVEAHNMPNQGFWLQDLGRTKVQAIGARLTAGTGIDVEMHAQRFCAETEISTPILVAAVDSMTARAMVFEAFLRSDALIMLDGRMGARYGRTFVVRKDDIATVAAYRLALHSDADGSEEPCTAKATIFCAFGLTGLLVGQLVNWILGEFVPFETSADFSHSIVSRSAAMV